MRISVLGGGSWGTALSVHLARKGFQVRIWEFFEEQAKEMQEKRVCKLLPGALLPDDIYVSSDMGEVLQDSELVLIVVPSDKVEETIGNAKKYLSKQPFVICSKGFASGTTLLSEVVSENVEGNVYCLYGPTHAEEVCNGMLSGIVLAGKDSEERDRIFAAFNSNSLKVDLSEDVVGVQICSALKNFLAIFIGILDGKELGDNAKAFMITKGLEEIKRIGVALGGEEETFYGLAGIGDVIVTCTSKHSRNRYLGEQIGKGKGLNEVIEEMHMVAEGVNAVKNAVKFKEKFDIEIPLIMGLHDILFANKDVDEVLRGV
jgi:glycerol-3-phosphate dehydrogenase (NAD(P)+)